MERSKETIVRKFFENQGLQAVILATLFYTFDLTYERLEIPSLEWLGLTTRQWYQIALITPLVHQPYVWICWRSELYYKALSKTLGKNAFGIYSTGFFILIIARFFSIFAVCFADYQSLGISLSTRVPLAFVIHLPGLYALYSVIRYFGFKRTPGEDHFKPEEYRRRSFVKQGLYKYSSNVMYLYMGLNFLALAIFCASKVGLLLTLYTYATVWTHYFCTEKPDIKYIYGK